MRTEPARWLITGGTGFLGRHLVFALKAKGFFVRSLSLDPVTKVEDVRKLGVDIHHGDILDPKALQKALDGMTIVVHLAGEKRNPDKFDMINVCGTQKVLSACLKGGVVRVIHISSAGVVGCAPDKIVTEETACRPRNRYEVSKYRAEQSALDFYHRHGLPVTILRPANVFGDLDPEKHLLNLMRQVQNRRFRFIGRREAWLNYVYAGDVAEACLLTAQEDGAVGQIYGVCDPCRLREFVEAVSQMLGVDLRQRRIPLGLAYGLALGFKTVSAVIRRPWPLTFDKIAIFRSQTIHCADKLKNEFGNWPRFGWGEGVKRTLSWYRAQEWL